jgi:hypothetical protein
MSAAERARVAGRVANSQGPLSHNRKLERYPQTVERDVTCERYRGAPGDATPEYLLYGRSKEILRRRHEVQARTIADRRTFDRSRRSQPSPALS